MTHPSRLKKALILSVFCAASLAVASPATAASGDPMKMVPADSLFCVRINNLDGALSQVDMFLSGLIPFGVSMPVKAQLAQFLGNSQPQGVDTSGGFILFGPLPGGAPDPSRIGLLVPISNYQQFVSANANVAQPDAQGFSQIGPPGAPMLTALEVGGYALVSTIGNESALTALKTSGAASNLGASLDAAELKRSTDTPLWAYANIELAGKMFGPMLQAKIAEMKQTMQALEQQGQEAMAKQATANFEAAAQVLDTLMKEAKYLSLALTPSFDKVGLTVTLAGVPGSELADTFKGSGSGTRNKLLGYMNNGAAMNFAGTMDSPLWKKLNEASIDMMSKAAGEGAMGDEVAGLKKMVTDAMEAFGGALAGSFFVDTSSKPPLRVTYVADVKDPAKYYQIMEQASKLMTSGSVGKLYEEMGMKCKFDLKKNASTYEGVAIDEVTFGLKATDADAPQAQAINAIYGDGLDIQLATVNNQLVYALGSDADDSVKKLIDQVKAGGPGEVPSEVQSAMALIPGADKADFFATLNILRLMKLVGEFAPTPMPQMDIPSQSNIAIAGDTGNGKMTIDVAVPKQHVQEAMAIVMMMQQQQMQN